MKKLRISMILLALIIGAQTKTEAQLMATNQTNKIMTIESEKKAIEQLLFTYRDALNASSVAQVLPLYTADGIFMPTNAPSAIGPDQLKGSYEFVFKTIQLHIEFFIDEIVIDGNHAFARTNSKGTTLIHASGQTVAEENRELFVLQKEKGDWKIARYMFNKTK